MPSHCGLFIEKSSFNSQSSPAEVPRVVSSRGRGRPRKRPATVVSTTVKREIAPAAPKQQATIVAMLTKQQQPMRSILASSSPDGNSGSVRPPVTTGKTTSMLGKMPTPLGKPSPSVLKLGSPGVSLVKDSTWSTSKLVVLKTTAGDKTQQLQPAKPDASSPGLLATGSSISSRPAAAAASSAAVVVIRSTSSSTLWTNTTPASPAAVSLLRGGVVMSVKKLAPFTVPLPVKAPAPPALAGRMGYVPIQPRLAPYVKLPTMTTMLHHTRHRQGSAVAMVSAHAGAMLQDCWRLPAQNNATGTTSPRPTPLTQRFVAFKNKSAPIQLAQSRFPLLAISNSKI